MRLPESEIGRAGPLFVRVNAPPGTELLVQARGKLAAALTLASSEIVLHNGRLADGRATTFSRMARAAASPLDRGPQLLPDGTTRVEVDELKRHIKSVSRPAASAIPANCCQDKADQAVVLRLSIGADGRVTHTRRMFGDRSLGEACAAAAKSGLSIRKLHEVISAGAVNSGLFQMIVGRMLEGGDLSGLKFTIANATKDLRYYTHFTEGMMIPSVVGEAVHQSLVTANALGFGEKFVPSLVEAQERLAGVKIVPRA